MEQINELLPVILAALVIWLVGLSSLFYWLFKHYKKLGSGVKTGNLIKVLDEVLDAEQTNTKQIKNLSDELSRQYNVAASYIQNIGFVRFNPFNETGGDHSFSIAVLDRDQNGFVLTSLHTRDRTRVYAKEIKSGKSNLDLSKEEEKALKKALK